VTRRRSARQLRKNRVRRSAAAQAWHGAYHKKPRHAPVAKERVDSQQSCRAQRAPRSVTSTSARWAKGTCAAFDVAPLVQRGRASRLFKRHRVSPMAEPARTIDSWKAVKGAAQTSAREIHAVSAAARRFIAASGATPPARIVPQKAADALRALIKKKRGNGGSMWQAGCRLPSSLEYRRHRRASAPPRRYIALPVLLSGPPHQNAAMSRNAASPARRCMCAFSRHDSETSHAASETDP